MSLIIQNYVVDCSPHFCSPILSKHDGSCREFYIFHFERFAELPTSNSQKNHVTCLPVTHARIDSRSPAFVLLMRVWLRFSNGIKRVIARLRFSSWTPRLNHNDRLNTMLQTKSSDWTWCYKHSDRIGHHVKNLVSTNSCCVNDAMWFSLPSKL